MNPQIKPDPDATILCLNVGSSSVKGALYRHHAGTGLSPLSANAVPAGPAAFDALLNLMPMSSGRGPDIVAHRVVHGGPDLTDHTMLDSNVRAQMEAATAFAPLHLPAELVAIDAAALRYPGCIQIVCFDTAFHKSLPDISRRLPIPQWAHDAGVRRYGFHGLSYESVVDQIGANTMGRAIVAHLGGGASLAAINEGRSVDTTMGLTPTGGVVMATRSGDLDPGVLLHLQRRLELDVDAVERLVDRESGLLGLSGSSGDVRVLLSQRGTDPAAALAVDTFCYSVRKAIGGLAAALGGLDCLVFTAGIGEHEPVIRSQICDGLRHIGVVLDADRNLRGDATISSSESSVDVRVVQTDENLMMAKHAIRLCQP